MLNVRHVYSQAIIKRLACKILLKEESPWQKLYEELQAAMSRAWNGNMRNAIAAALNHLREFDEGTFSQADADHILKVLEIHIGTNAMIAALHGTILNISELLYRVGFSQIGRETKLNLSFSVADLAAISVVQQSNLFWVGNSWNSHTNKLVRKILVDYYEQGLSRQQVTDRFARDFTGLTDRGRHYWELLADNMATRTREIGKVGSYQAAEVEYVQVRAHLDSRTTNICRRLHGTIIPVARLTEQRDRYLQAVERQDQESAKAVWRMWKETDGIKPSGSKVLPANTAMPPYHFGCRTITVAYFGNS